MIESLKFDGAAVVVSGAAAGIGRSCCELFTDLGARVIAVDIDATFVDSVHVSPSGKEWPDRFLLADVSKESEVVGIAREVDKEYGAIASLINVAGIGPAKSIGDMELSLWESVLATSLTSVFLMTREFMPLIESEFGSIVNVSSTYAFSSRSGKSAYSAAKGAIVSFTKTTAIEASKRGIRANAVCPGPVLTPRRKDSLSGGSDDLDAAIRRTLLGRFAEASEIANLIVFLASRAASFMTGSAVVIDGGQLTHIGEAT